MEHYRYWDMLVRDIKECTKCRLHLGRKNAVPGSGKIDASLMLIGEAPGATEDEMGLPFVGAAGKLLDSILMELGIKREDLYITNVVKCRPPNNRQPARDEIDACSIYLESQILLIKPKVIVTLGAIAGEWVCSRMGIKWLGVTRMRGRIYRGRILGLPVTLVPTYHPAAILRNKGEMMHLRGDLEMALRELEKIEENRSGKRGRTLLDYMRGEDEDT